MKPPRPVPRPCQGQAPRGILVPPLIALLALLACSAGAQEAASGDALPPPPAVESSSSQVADDLLTPELIDAIAKLVERCQPRRGEQAAAEMKALAGRLAREHELDPEAAALLERAGAQAAEDSLEVWADDLQKHLQRQPRRWASMYGMDAEAALHQIAAQGADDILRQLEPPEPTRPRQQAAWLEALDKALSPELAAAWKEGVAEEISSRQERLDAFLDEVETQVKLAEERKMQELAEEIAETTGLDAAGSRELDQVAAEAAAEEVKLWREFIDNRFQRVAEEYWSSYSREPANQGREQYQDWQERLAQVLDASQMAAWQAEVDRRAAIEEQALDDLLADSAETQVAAWQAQVQDSLSLLVSALDLDEALAARFAEAADLAVEQSLAAWKASARSVLRQMPETNRQNALRRSLFRVPGGPGSTSPEEQEAWTTALESLLAPAQQAAWQAELAVREEEEEKLIVELIDSTAESHGEQIESSLEPRVLDLVSSLSLDAERAEALKTAAAAAVAESLERWKNRAREWIAALDPPRRREMSEQGHIPVGFGEEQAAENQPAWSAAMSTILTADELDRWEVIRASRRERRHRAVAGVIVASVEDWIGLSPAQWDQLAALCQAPAAGLTDLFDQQHFYLNAGMISQALGALADSQVQEILGESQWTRWQQAKAQLEGSVAGARRRVNLGEEEPGELPLDDELAVEAAITILLQERSAERRQEALSVLLAEAELNGNAAGLPPETQRRLLTAAKGAAEHAADLWDETFTRHVRERTKDATPRTIRQQLAAVGNYSRHGRDPRESALWQRSLDTILGEAQRGAWQEAAASRDASRRRAVAEMSAAYFEARLGLSEAQSTRLRDLVDAALGEYGPDIERHFSSRASPWYLQYYTMGLALLGIPEPEMKDLLSPAQLEAWETQHRENASNYWQIIQRYHQERTRQSQP